MSSLNYKVGKSRFCGVLNLFLLDKNEDLLLTHAAKLNAQILYSKASKGSSSRYILFNHCVPEVVSCTNYNCKLASFLPKYTYPK